MLKTRRRVTKARGGSVANLGYSFPDFKYSFSIAAHAHLGNAGELDKKEIEVKGVFILW